MSRTGGSFPHPAYARYVLEPGFRESQRLIFSHMMAANEAHTLMLVETGIISREHASALLAALRQVNDAGVDSFTYAPEVEDLFFAIENRLIDITGPEIGGNLQIARSRNDLAAVVCRLMIRERLATVQDVVLVLRATLLDLAGEHVCTIMPGITHTQPAQPTTLAHYLLGVLGPLERDSERLRQAWSRVNRSPLGVAAFTTTSFPVDRDLAAALLGFDGVVENGYDAVGAGDHMLESVQALVTLVGSLSRFVYELLIWTRAEVGILRIADEFIQISSIMPQKRNPVVLEHVRARVGYVYGDAATVATMIHSAAFGDTNDVEDEIYVPIARAFDATESVLTLLDVSLQTASFNVDLLAERAGQGNTTTTAIADGLVRDFGLPFRTAHGVVSRLVAEGGAITSARIAEVAQGITGQHLDIDEAWAKRTLDPWNFIKARTIRGGPAPATTAAAVGSGRERLARDRQRLERAEAQIREAAVNRAARIAEYVAPLE